MGAYALSEAGSGSDAFALQTRAEKSGRRLSAERPQAVDLECARRRGCLWCLPRSIRRRAIAGLRRFSSRKSTPGFSVGRKEDKLGIRASSTCELLFDDCEVPAANLLGEAGKGYKIAIEIAE